MGIQGALEHLESANSGASEHVWRSFTWNDLVHTGKISAETAGKYSDLETRFVMDIQPYWDFRTKIMRSYVRFEITPAIHIKEAPFAQPIDLMSWARRGQDVAH
jgi:hypothetical protein